MIQSKKANFAKDVIYSLHNLRIAVARGLTVAFTSQEGLTRSCWIR